MRRHAWREWSAGDRVSVWGCARCGAESFSVGPPREGCPNFDRQARVVPEDCDEVLVRRVMES